MCGGKRSEGFTLVEVLVSVLILGIGLLGLAGLQNIGAAAGYSALQRSQASWLPGWPAKWPICCAPTRTPPALAPMT